jgi:hypothetical protein
MGETRRVAPGGRTLRSPPGWELHPIKHLTGWKAWWTPANIPPNTRVKFPPDLSADTVASCGGNVNSKHRMGGLLRCGRCRRD